MRASAIISTAMLKSNLILKFCVVLLASVALVGCDSGGDNEEAGDAERFLGVWQIVSAADQGGARDQTAVFSMLGTFTLTLNEDQSYTLMLEYADGETPALVVPGTYAVNTSSSTLVLGVQLEGLPQVDLELDYAFNGDDEVEFTADAATLVILLGAQLEGDVVLVGQKL